MTKCKIPTPDALIAGIQQAERELEKSRDAMVQNGWVNDWQFVSTQFVLNFENLLLAVRDAVNVAEKSGDGAFMRLLQPVLDATSRLVMARRAIDGDRINSGAAKLNRLTQTLDQLILIIRRLDVPQRGPVIKSPRQIQKSLNQPGDSPDKWLRHICGVWPHVSAVEINKILFYESEPDLDPATHPDVIAWRKAQAGMPSNWDDSLLVGECRGIERSRQLGHAPAIA